MMMAKKASLYSQLISATEDYLGPTSKRFIDRQIESHLSKKPESLTKKDLVSLNDWIIAVVALLTDDEKILAEYSSRLADLTKTKTVKG